MACHGFWMLLAWGFASENQNLGFEPLKNGNSPGFRSPPISFFFYWVLSKIQNGDSTGPKLGLEAPKIIKQMKFHLT
jgi:hypothetical protein